MAVELMGQDIGYLKANADLSSKQYYGMKFSTTDWTFQIATAGACDAILQDKPAAAGRAGSLRISGGSKVVLGGTVTAGQHGTTDANGAFVAVTTDKQRYVCKFIEGGDSGDTVSAIMERGYYAV